MSTKLRGNPNFGPNNPYKFPQSEADRPACSRAIYVRLTDEVYLTLKDKAAELGIPVSSLARVLIEKAVFGR